MIVSFKFYVMNFVGFVLIAIHISPHMYLKFFANFTHYISYSLLNIIDVIMCVSQSDQPNLQLLWVLVQNIFCGWEFKRRMFENLKFGKTGFKTCVLEKHFITYSCILFLIFNALRIFSKNQVIFSKILVFLFFFSKFRSIQSVFRSIKITFKIFCELLSVSINRNWFSINRKTWISFF